MELDVCSPERLKKMQNIAYKRGGWCLSPDYSDSKTKLWWQCGEGHIWDDTPGQIKNSKSWCLTCFKIKRKRKRFIDSCWRSKI